MSEHVPCCRDLINVRDVLCAKSIKGVVAARPDMPVREAADLMLSAGVGALLVFDESRLAGILTERDMVRMARDAMVADQVLVRDVMNVDVVCCGDEVSVDEISEVMRVRRVRHVPVLDANENIIGVVSIGDINAHRVGQCEVTLNQLEHYVYRRT